MMFKHNYDTLKTAKLANDVTFGFSALFCVLLAAASVIYTIYELTQAPSIPDIITFIAVDTALILLTVFLTAKFREHRALESEIAVAGEAESEFFKINCVKTSAILTVGTPLGTGTGKVQGFYITAEGGKKYVFICHPALDFKKYSESAPDLFGILYVRKYKGTNLLCEIKKSI